MEAATIVDTLRSELERELTERILPYWLAHTVDERDGGFVGRILPDGHVVPDAPKGSILNARILWSFAAASRALPDPAYHGAARRAHDYLQAHFWDPRHGGVYWMLDHRGQPLDERKHVYAQAFAVYALSEYASATGESAGLDRAKELFRLIEAHAADAVHGGYREAFGRDWTPVDDVRLSDKDAPERRSLNTHLHLLEAYTGLYRAWPDRGLRERLQALLELFLSTFHDPVRSHFRLFFDEDWTVRSHDVSYGHDIETSWLILEAADALEAPALRARTRTIALAVAAATRREGLDADGGLFNDGGPAGPRPGEKHWWPQAEAMVGFVSAYRETGDEAYLEAAAGVWKFVKRRILDLEHGEWRWGMRADGTPTDDDKVGPWKCPYHNVRACLEVVKRARLRST